jgi:DNA-binding protein HU-beta
MRHKKVNAWKTKHSEVKKHLYLSFEKSENLARHMNKADLANKIAEDLGITKVQATAAIECLVEGVTKSLKAGKKVTLMGFGTFSVTKRAARKGRNPKTGESIRIKAKKVAKFRPSQELNASI